MKGNFQFKLAIFLLLSCFCWLKPTSGKAQCSNEIYLKEIIKSSENQQNGIIAVSIKAEGDYDCLLYRMSGAKNELIKSIKGQGDQLIEFNELPPYGMYKVVAMFHSEEDLRCRKRQVADISTLE